MLLSLRLKRTNNPLIPKLHHFAHNETCFILAQNGYGLLPQLPFNRKYQAVVYISGQKSGNEVVHFETTVYICKRYYHNTSKSIIRYNQN